MLSALAADFHQTESGVGLAVTAYGWVGALAALLSGAMPTRISRKALLVGLMPVSYTHLDVYKRQVQEGI